MIKKRHKILLVDNEQELLNSLMEFLQEENYEVHLARNGVEGIELLNEAGPFSLIISDYRMPYMMGDEFLKQAKKISFNTPRMLITAWQDSRLISSSINDLDVFAFMDKPIDLDNLKRMVLLAVKKYQDNIQATYAHRVLFVGNKIGLKQATKDALCKQGFNLHFAQNLKELESAYNLETPISMLVISRLDDTLDEMKILEASKAIYPEAVRVLLIDSSNLSYMKQAINEAGVHKILLRPFDHRQIEEVLTSSILKYHQSRGGLS